MQKRQSIEKGYFIEGYFNDWKGNLSYTCPWNIVSLELTLTLQLYSCKCDLAKAMKNTI